MELKEYFKIIGKRWWVVLLTVLILGGGTYIFQKSQPKTYLASTTLTVNKASAMKQSQVNYYLYDNYYNVQSSQLFSQIVTSWFGSPAVITEIYQKAGVAVPNIAQAQLPKQIKALRQEPATINVSLVNANRDDALKLIDSAASVMQEKTNELARSDQENVYDIVKFQSIVTDNQPNLMLNTLIGLIIGLMFGIVLTLSVEYFRKW